MSQRLVVSANGRFLQFEDGRPFFYLADTAWELLHRLTLDDADRYLKNRAAKGFTVIQTVALAELDGLRVPNMNGDLPLVDLDPAQPNEPYFAHVDRVLAIAESLGMFLALLSSWGDKWSQGTWGEGPEIFTPANAHAYGSWLGRRYAARSVIWVLGGDRRIETEDHRAIIDAMAAGLREGHGGTQLATFHPCGGEFSSAPFHDAPWLDFNMIQSGHGRDARNDEMIAKDYARHPVKPCMDGEPGYEDHPAGFDLANGYLDDHDCRRSAYWAVFSGAHGHTYGCHAIWQMARSLDRPVNHPRRDWREAMDLPGAAQMGFLRRLMLSRPFFSRIPDPGLLLSDAGKGPHRRVATRCAEGTYAMVYCPTLAKIEIDGSRLTGEELDITWFNPRNGTSIQEPRRPRQPKMTFETPWLGMDWILILDAAAHRFPQP